MSSDGTGAIAAGGEGIAAGEVVFWTDIIEGWSGVCSVRMPGRCEVFLKLYWFRHGQDTVLTYERNRSGTISGAPISIQLFASSTSYVVAST